MFEFATTLDCILVQFIAAGITTSSWKFILTTPQMEIVGSLVSKCGWHLKHRLITKIQNWPVPHKITDVHGFLGTAGVGCKWIKGYANVTHPLTNLTQKSESPFFFGHAELTTFELLKKQLSSAPILRQVNFAMAKTANCAVSLDSIIVVAIDGSKYSAGWTLSQTLNGTCKPALFGSCTYSHIESSFSQPKAELYALFCTFKELCHHLWGCHFHIEVDTQYLQEMISSPSDVPNAPMLYWISFISLFDFHLIHVPTDHHKVADSLSQRPLSNDNSDVSDVDNMLDRYINTAEHFSPPHPSLSSCSPLSASDFLLMTASSPPMPQQDSLQLPFADSSQPSHKGEVFFLCDETSDGSPSTSSSSCLVSCPSSPSDVLSLHSMSDDDEPLFRLPSLDPSSMGLLPCMLAHPSLPNVFPSSSAASAPALSASNDEECILLQIVLYLNGCHLPNDILPTSSVGKTLLHCAQCFFLEGDCLWCYGVKNEHP